LKNSARIIEACARLHNYVLDCKVKDDDDGPDESNADLPEIHAMAGSPLGWCYIPTVEEFVSMPGISHTRDAVLRKITREGFREKIPYPH